MSVTAELLAADQSHQQGFQGPLPPVRKVAVLACLDARLDPATILGLSEGDAHVIRNAGGVATDDALRSLTTSQRLLGTEEIVLVHHTDCGVVTFSDEAFRQDVERDGLRPSRSSEAFPDAAADVRRSVNRIKGSPFIPKTDQVRGFVFDVATGALDEVS